VHHATFHGSLSAMNVTMDAAGRLVVPKQIRIEAGLRPAVPLEIRCRDGRIEIEPAARKVKRMMKGRVAVALPAETSEALAADKVRRVLRELRDSRE